MKVAALLLVLLAAPGEAAPDAEAQDQQVARSARKVKPAKSARSPEQEALEAIAAHVAGSRNWKREEYRIEAKGLEGHNRVYWVVHRDDEGKSPRSPGVVNPGGGRSFAVVWDPLGRKVVRELALQ